MRSPCGRVVGGGILDRFVGGGTNAVKSVGQDFAGGVPDGREWVHLGIKKGLSACSAAVAVRMRADEVLMRSCLSIALCSVALLLTACGPERRYHLEVIPLPEGAERRVTGTLRVDNKDETIDAALPMVWDREADSLSGVLNSPGAGGLRLRMSVLPKSSVLMEIEKQASGEAGVRGTITERHGEHTWGMEVEVVPLVPAAPAAAPAAVPVPAPQ